MSRTTIDYGIDLGTTNSSIACMGAREPEVVPNRDGASFTPSAVWIDRRGRRFIGRAAKEQVERDPENAAAEFKLRMGEGDQAVKVFQRTGEKMLPEEMSAEVLKSLRADVRATKGEEPRAAVITVPAAFELAQCMATRKAAELAGFTLSPLVQEPVAAAMAYGFGSSTENVFWLVYDFGGGTFDAAVIQVRDGAIHVVNHAGNNFLGGKNIDWDIVEKKLVPRLTAERTIAGFTRSDPKWRAAFAKLKGQAEAAKVQVCLSGKAQEVWVENLCADEAGDPIDFACELTPQDIQEIIAPYVTQSINLCKQALTERRLSGSDVQKVIMVGGTSLIPWLREQVERELKARLEFSVDPITVVARGAAVFASTQRLPLDELVRDDRFGIVLDYEPFGNEPNPLVGGRVLAPAGVSAAGTSLEFSDIRGAWRSGRVRVSAEGKFVTELHAEPGRNEYAIELTDSTGSLLACQVPPCSYTRGVAITSPPLIHSIGLAQADNQVDVLIPKGAPLPARNRTVHRTVRPLARGQSGDVLKIAVVEGENFGRADRNNPVGHLKIPADRISRDIPVGSEVEITLDVDASRLVTARAYVPILDATFEQVLKMDHQQADADALNASLTAQMSRLAAARRDVAAAGTQVPAALAALSRIDAEGLPRQASSLVSAARGDPDAAKAAQKCVRDLQGAIDAVEDALVWPRQAREAEELVESTLQIVNAHGNEVAAKRLAAAAQAIRDAISARDPDLLRQQVEAVRALRYEVLQGVFSFWIDNLGWLKGQQGRMRDPAMAKRLIERADQAIEKNDIEALRASVRQLQGLMPPEYDKANPQERRTDTMKQP